MWQLSDLEMETTNLRFEDQLDGASNFLPQKARVTLLLKENDLWEIVDKEIQLPTDPTQLVAHKKDIRAQGVIMDAVKGSLGKEGSQGDVQGFSGLVLEG